MTKFDPGERNDVLPGTLIPRRRRAPRSTWADSL